MIRGSDIAMSWNLGAPFFQVSFLSFISFKTISLLSLSYLSLSGDLIPLIAFCEVFGFEVILLSSIPGPRYVTTFRPSATLSHSAVNQIVLMHIFPEKYFLLQVSEKNPEKREEEEEDEKGRDDEKKPLLLEEKKRDRKSSKVLFSPLCFEL